MPVNLIDFDDDQPSFDSAGNLSISSLNSSGHIHVRESVLRTPSKESGAVSDLLWLIDDHGDEEDSSDRSAVADASINAIAKANAPREPDAPATIELSAIINTNSLAATTPAFTPPEDIILQQRATAIDLPLADDLTSPSTAEITGSTIAPLAAEGYPLPPSPLPSSAGSGDTRSTLTAAHANANSERLVSDLEPSPPPAPDSSAECTDTKGNAVPPATPTSQTNTHSIVTRPTQAMPTSPTSTCSPLDPGPAAPRSSMPAEGMETRKSDPYERHPLVHVPSFPYPRPAASVAAASGKTAPNGTPTALWWANGQVAVPYGHQTDYQYGVQESWGSPVNFRYAHSATNGPDGHSSNYMVAQNPAPLVQLPTSKPIRIKSPASTPTAESSSFSVASPPFKSAASPSGNALLAGHASPGSAAEKRNERGVHASDSDKTVEEGQVATADHSAPISPDGESGEQDWTVAEIEAEGNLPLLRGSTESEGGGLALKSSGVELFFERFNKHMSDFASFAESTSELKALWRDTGALIEDNLAQAPEDNDNYASRLKQLLLTQREIKVLRESQTRLQTALAASQGSCQSWEKRCTLLTQTCLGLEDEREALQRLLRQSEGRASRGSNTALSVVLVLLEGRTFDPASIKKGSKGGAELVSALASVVRDHLEEMGAPMGDLIINCIGDLYTLRHELSQTVQIASAETVDGFLSGISEEDPLYSVMDVRGRFGATNKIAAQMRAFCEVGSNCQVFLVASSDELFRPTIDELASRDLTSRLWAVRGANNVAFKQIPSTRTIGMNDLFIKSTDEWERRAAKMAGSTPTSAETPATPLFLRRAQPPTPVSPTTTVPSPQGSTPKASVVGRPSLQTAIAAGFSVTGVPKPSVSPAPVSPLLEPAPSPPWKETKAIAGGGGSLLDRLMASRAEAVPEKATTGFMSPREGMSMISSRTGGPQTPEGRELQQRIGARMNVRIDPSVDGSIGGSPPDSDEDQPSVQLPHSHEQTVQRPVKINAVHPSRAGVVARANRAASRARSSSIISTDSLFSNAIRQMNDSASQIGLKGNANTTPLGIRKTSTRR